jgi:Zn-dependent M16 (insulinase) family peptidase
VTNLPRKLGIRLPAQVSYACTGYRLDQCGETYRGTAQLAANILSLSCLWNSVRVQGGAYGAGMDCDRSGSLYCYSYRDPSPARSLGIYRELAAFLRARGE